jgi:hypothetical protein
MEPIPLPQVSGSTHIEIICPTVPRLSIIPIIYPTILPPSSATRKRSGEKAA